jgi:hypothetical protein
MRSRLILTALGVGALASAIQGQSAAADEIHIGPHVTLLSTGEINDPMEDVLENASIFSTGQKPAG